MRRLVNRVGPLAVVAAVLVLLAPRLSCAQEPCRGDVDDDGQVTTADAEALLPLLFQGADVDAGVAARADANDDGVLTSADVAAILRLNGLECQVPTTAPSPTRTPTTPNATSTPTRTRTPLPTPTPTQVCIVQPVQPGTSDGVLTTTDCQRTFRGQVRHTDAYSISGTLGQAIRIEVSVGTPTPATPPASTPGATPTLVPAVMVVDSGGQFGSVLGPSPIEFVVSSTSPYQFFVTSDPSVPEQLGAYTLTVSARSCPTPVALPLQGGRNGTLGPPDCPDPAFPSAGTALNLVDVYTLQVSQVPTNISLRMAQSVATDDLNPVLTVIGPDGFELFTSDLDAGGGLNESDELVRFLALQAGTYTVLAGGGTGRYALTLSPQNCNATALTAIPSDAPQSIIGTLYGDPSKTRCAAPLPVLGSDSEDVPDLNSPADIYTFNGTAGEVISVEMISDDDPHLFLLGPDTAGNPLITTDDDSSLIGGANAQLAATLPVTGTYTIIAANNNALEPPASRQDTGDTVSYTLFVQKCGVSGGLNLATGAPLTQTYNAFECFGFGGLPFRTYAFNGTEGQFVSATMTSDSVDAFVRIFGPDGSRVENDDDPFEPLGTNARVNRILPATGTYFVEVSTSLDGGPVDVSDTPAPGFTAQVKSCQATAVSPGSVNGTFADGDCELSPGRKFDVYTLTPSADPPRVASIRPPSNGCVLALLAEGPQIAVDSCSTDPLDIPMLSKGTYGFIVAGNGSTLGAYSAQVNNCPLSSLTFGDTKSATLAAADCASATGLPADWYLVRAPADLVHFNTDVMFGTVEASFPLALLLSDIFGGVPLPTGAFSDDADSMFVLGNDLGVLVRVAGTRPEDLGNYTISVDSADLRE